jgi:hypothetical protein
MILIFFVYEFARRMNYLNEIDEENKDKEYKKKDKEYFDTNMTYLPQNFSNEFERNINVKNILKDLGVKRSINQVVAIDEDPLPTDFFTPLDLKLFRTDMNRWVNKQRDWQEVYTILDPIIEQKKNITENIIIN